MAAVFGSICALAFVWAAVKYQIVYHAVINSLPPQFQGGEISRYAFPEYVRRPSTPLELQTEYMKSLAGGCLAMPCFSLSCFIGGQPVGGWLAFVASLAISASTFKAWRTYKENRDRPMARGHGEET
jgi:hypothetical protein